MLNKGTAIPFHKKLCPGCHNIPKSKEWMASPETTGLHVFHIGKRTGYFVHWEPIFIGTHSDPLYDERLSWEGKSDKMTQVKASHSLSDSTASFALLLVSGGSGSIAGRATGYGLDGPGSNPGRGEIFRTCPDRPWGPRSLLYNGYRVFPGGKERPGRDADPLSPSSAVVKK